MGFWPFAAKAATIKDSGMLAGSTDWHSHILPGVDDGFKDPEKSLKAIDALSALGVKKLWLTPHIMEDVPNETDKLREKFEEFKQLYKGDVELHLAAENMLDILFEERLEKNDFLPLGETGNHLLVETSYFNPPMGMMRMLEEVQSKGYFPVLAHPERYRYMDEKDYDRLKEAGIIFQANYFSMVGAYGETARKKLDWLLKKGYIDMMGSDMHKLEVMDHVMESRPKSKASLTAMAAVANNSHKL